MGEALISIYIYSLAFVIIINIYNKNKSKQKLDKKMLSLKSTNNNTIINPKIIYLTCRV